MRITSFDLLPGDLVVEYMYWVDRRTPNQHQRREPGNYLILSVSPVKERSIIEHPPRAKFISFKAIVIGPRVNNEKMLFDGAAYKIDEFEVIR